MDLEDVKTKMEQNKRARRALRSNFTKLANALDSLLQAKIPDEVEIQLKWSLLVEKRGDMDGLDADIRKAKIETCEDDAVILSELEGIDEYQTVFRKLKARVSKIIKEDTDPAVANDSSISGATNDGFMRKFKLPILELKKFNGELKEWLPFWTQFQKIDEDSSIPPEDKFQYLQQAIVPKTRARELIDSYPLSRENYPKALAALKSRFGRDELLIEVYVRELLKLVLQNTMSTENKDLAALYDKLETQLRALETLGVTTEKYEAMLFPLIESALPEEMLRIWQRSPLSCQTNKEKSRLKNLMEFIGNEVDAEQRISLAVEGFNLRGNETNKKGRKPETRVPTVAGLINNTATESCIFCDGHHSAEKCFKGQKLSFDEKSEILMKKKACFKCAKIGHPKRRCPEILKCMLCGRSHVPILCPDLNVRKTKSVAGKDKVEAIDNKNKSVPEVTLSNFTNAVKKASVFLQTLKVKLYDDDPERERVVRAIFDSGSQKSYILSATARELNYQVKRTETTVHALFGGTQTSEQSHKCYEVRISSMSGDYRCKFEVMDQPIICNQIRPVHQGEWIKELKNRGIQLSDTEDDGPIELLIGSDVGGKLMTGSKEMLSCGLVAMQTMLGWVLTGKVPNQNQQHNTTMTVVSLLNKTVTIKDLWELDSLGITDPKEKLSKTEQNKNAEEIFNRSIRVDGEGRYEVRLPWVEEHPPLPTNEMLARKRLESTLKKLNSTGYYEKYQEVFNEWCQEGIIERVHKEENSTLVHYLPHRPVIKESSTTTKIRPVFDASARELGYPSLNHCLEKGENLIELIPDVLSRFRQGKLGIIADIKKAFLQISVHEADRNYLRFLWKTKEGIEEVYRHRRVVFGVSSSPFLLAATISFHLNQSLNNCEDAEPIYSEQTVKKLINSFYVDNCVTSLNNETEIETFMKEASIIMNQGQFELRGWEFSNDTNNEIAPVLGLNWNKRKDTFSLSSIDVPSDEMKITKRNILSITQKIFDPIGFSSPATLQPKLMLQNLWLEKKGWDEVVDKQTELKFKKWLEEVPYLETIEIPRWLNIESAIHQQVSLHCFCDASAVAYAATIFLRVESPESVRIHLLVAKARVSPLKKLSIPRLELLAANIGARLYVQVKKTLNVEHQTYFWSDSSTALSWIRKTEEWSTFVWNRVQKIRQTTDVERWRHVPGNMNPADLLSRGCSPKSLALSKWWEGPDWLHLKEESWPKENVKIDEREINSERKKSASKAMICTENYNKFYSYFSTYQKNVRMIAWIFRFVYNAKNKQRRKGELLQEEIDSAEKFLIKIIQKESSSLKRSDVLSSLNVFQDEEGTMRVKSHIVRREDFEEFLYPYLLPADHPIVKQLVLHIHVKSCHIKAQGLLSILRERFWILGGRRTIRTILNSCVTCKRHSAKKAEVNAPPLPAERVRDAAVFEVVGVDLAGPVYLRDGKKGWICLFTCAVYRAIHLELVKSLSANDFIKALRRFIARRGRPKYIFSDNGTNFRGTENLLSRLNWNNILENTSMYRICWRFNPPSAPWWGGFWERLIGTIKQLLKRTLGRACLTDEEFITTLCDCEVVINSRPLTYMSNEPSDLVPLTPNMFLTDAKQCGVPDLDRLDTVNLNKRYQYLQRLRNELRKRFRIEYLGFLKQNVPIKVNSNVSVGDLVLIGGDNSKRLDWPLGRVVELVPGRDSTVRVVRVQTEHGQLLRPIQRIYSLEGVSTPGDLMVERQSTPGDLMAERQSTPGDMVAAQHPTPDCVAEECAPVQISESDVFGAEAPGASVKNQRFYFANQPQSRFVPTYQSSDNGYYQPQVTNYRQNSPGFNQPELFEGDLQTSDLPPHLAQTLPQYQYSRFAQPAVQHPVPFQLPSKSNQDTYLYDDDTSSRVNQQVPRPQPFQPAPKPKSKQPHSHYLTSSRNHDPSQTETFLGQITLQSPDLHPDFNPDIPGLKPSKDYQFHSSSLVDQFSQGSDKWRRPQNVPIGVSRPTKPRTSNKPFRELSDTVDQHLEEFLEKENHSREDSRRSRPQLTSVDRQVSNSVQSNSNSNISSRFRPIPPSGRGNKQKSQTNGFWVNNNGDVIPTTIHNFSPKPTSTLAPTNAPERRNRFQPTTKAPSKPLAFHLKSNKIPFAPKRTTTTSTTENNFDLESLLEDPIDNQGEHFEHDDDVEVIQSIVTTSLPTTEETSTLPTETENTEFSTTQEDDNTSTETREVETVDYSQETTQASTDGSTVDDVKPTDQATSENHKDDSTEYEYYDDDISTHFPTGTAVTEDSRTTTVGQIKNEDVKTTVETITDSSTTSETSTTENLSTASIPNFDVVTVKPARIVEGDNFNHFVDSGLIDSNSEEFDKFATLSTPEPTVPDTTITTEQSPTTEIPKIEEPVLIGEQVVSVVTTKSVINGTVSVPTPQPQVTEQMSSPDTSNDTSSESWMVVASVQTSRSVSGARYIPLPINTDDNRAKLLNEQSQDYTDEITENTEQDNTSERPVKDKSISSTESISDKLDRVQSELSSGFLSGGFRNAISVITEQVPTTMPPTTTPTTTTTTTTTQRPTTTPVPVIIRKFSPNLRPSTTERARKRPPVFENIKQDDLSGLLPPGFKPKYQNSRTTTSTTETAFDLELPQGDEPVRSTETKSTVDDNVNSYKVPKESDLPKDPVKTLEDFLGKVRSQAANNNKPKNKADTSTPKEESTTEKTKIIEKLFANAEPADISAFLPPGFKLTTEKPTTKNITSILTKAQPIDISSFLPPGYKPPKEDKPKNTTSNLLAKAQPVDISSFLPPGYKAPKTSQNDSKPENKTEKPKGVAGLLAEAVPVDISAFLPPGYKGKIPTPKPRTEATQEASTSRQPSSTVASTTASSGGSKVVFPTRPGGRKPISRITTPRQHNQDGGGSAMTAPSIQKGWPSRATTEFTGWPTPSTTPISIEKLLEAARTATSASSTSEEPILSTSTTTTTTTTTTPAPTTPGICSGECDLAGTIKLVGGASWVPELLDHNTKEWQILANEVQTQLEKAYSKSAILSKWYKKIRVDEFSPGSVLVDYTVELTDLGRKVNTIELKSLFNEALNSAPAASARSFGKSESIRDRNTTKLALGPYVVDPTYTDFIVLPKNIAPTVGYADDNVLLPQWAIAVIVIGLASLLFVIIFGVTVLVNRQKNAKKKQPTPLTEEMLNELNKNHMGGLDNYGADDLYNMEDVWNDKAYDMKPPKKRSAGSIHDNSMSNLYDSWRSEWNGYYYNAYYGNGNGNSNSAGGSNGGFQRRRSDYDTNF